MNPSRLDADSHVVLRSRGRETLSYYNSALSSRAPCRTRFCQIEERILRSLIVTIISTLDGYAAGEGGDVFAMPIDLGFDHYNLSRMREASTLLFGAQTFRAARVYWPQPADNSEAPEVERQISRLYNTLEKVVISDTLKPEDTTPWATSTEVIPRTAALDRIIELKAGSSGDILCFGSLTTWNSLLALGLVDELHVLIGPGVIGSGLPTFTQAVKRRLTLLGTDRVEDSSLVALRYRVGGTA